MKIIGTTERFKLNEETDDYEFFYTQALAVDDCGVMYSAKTGGRMSDPIEPENEQWTEIPVHHICPRWSPDLTLFQLPTKLPIYIKKPWMIGYDHDDDMAEALLHEAKIYETIVSWGSPYLAQYHGCLVSSGRIAGLALSNYDCTLEDRIDQGFTHIEAARWFEQIRCGVELLHHNDLAHNDLNPSNVMINNGDAVIVDFDSCRRLGEDLVKCGTIEWADEDAVVSATANDTFSLQKLAVALNISPPGVSLSDAPLHAADSQDDTREDSLAESA